MAVLPESSIDVSKGIAFQNYPSLTFYADPVTHRITGMADGYQAVKQTIEIILNVERFRWQIYSPYFGMEWNGIIGQEPNYAALEVQRRMRDAFSTDSRITGISDFRYEINGDNLTVSVVVNTVYGDVGQTFNVNI